MKGTLTRVLTKKECPLLAEDLCEGTIVYKYTGFIYGCISDSGIAVTLHSHGRVPFFEIPKNSVSWSE